MAITTSHPAFAARTIATARSRARANFCNADDDLLPLADLWLHGHLHCRHDIASRRRTAVTDTGRQQCARARRQGEADGFDGLRIVDAAATT